VVEARKAFDLMLALISLDTAVELADREQGHDLRKDGAASAHTPKLACDGAIQIDSV
jgi:hypothetical protein